MNTDRIIYDASDLGLPVGQFPEHLSIHGVPACRIKLTRDFDDDIVSATYRTIHGETIVVYND